MTHRENTLAILNYEKYERMPVISFGYWLETLEKWAAEGHITKSEYQGYMTTGDSSPADFSIMEKLGIIGVYLAILLPVLRIVFLIAAFMVMIVKQYRVNK